MAYCMRSELELCKRRTTFSADFASPKAIANKIKAKGLQKLRFYCQMCNKQCRDENGFKCHLTSESHKRQMDVFGQNPHKVIQDYSVEFERSFLEHLRRTHPFSRVEANIVYNEFIQDRHHVHMNATKWLSLTEFVKYLGREGKCKVDETPKGWFVTLIQEDPFEAMERKKRKEREKSEREADERHLKVLRAQAEKVRREQSEHGEGETETPHVVEHDTSGIAFPTSTVHVKMSLVSENRPKAKKKDALVEFDDADVGETFDQRTTGKRSKVEQLMTRELEIKASKRIDKASSAMPQTYSRGTEDVQEDVWICQNIVVKVMSPSLKEHGYFKRKGRITKVEGYEAEIEMFDSGDVIRVDQQELETVIPSAGKRVLVVRGPHKGKTGTLESLLKERYGAMIKIHDNNKPETKFLEYEYFSKI